MEGQLSIHRSAELQQNTSLCVVAQIRSGPIPYKLVALPLGLTWGAVLRKTVQPLAGGCGGVFTLLI